MHIRIVFLLMSCVLTSTTSFPQTIETLNTPEKEISRSFEFVGPGIPELVGWAGENREGASVANLSKEDNIVEVGLKQGCMAFVRSGAIPVIQKIEPEAGSQNVIQGLVWENGSIVAGDLEDEAKLPVSATVAVKYESSAGAFADPACHTALSALGLFELSTGNVGHFEFSALPPGRLLLTIEAEGYSTVQRRLTLTVDHARYDLGALLVPQISVVNVSVDPSEIDEDPPFTLVIEIERPESISQQDRWGSAEELELPPDAPVRVETRPGLHRFSLEKPGTDLAYSLLAELSGGSQDLVIRPAPFFLEGSVMMGGDHVDGAEVMLLYEDLQLRAYSDEEGSYQLRLWVPADFASMVMAPSGGSLIDHLDLRDAQPGETIEHDFDIPTNGVSGVVVSSRDQQPVGDCEVTLIQKSTERGTNQTITTASDGRFTFGSVWESDTCRIRAHKNGFLPASKEIPLMGSDNQDVWIELDPSTAITGRVTGPSGEPLSGVQVGCCAPGLSDPLAIRTTTSADGSFSIEANPGVVLFASAQGYALGWSRALEGQENHIILPSLPQPTRLRIVNSEDRPIEGAFLTYASLDGVGIPFDLVVRHTILNGLGRQTDHEGKIDVASVPYGMYQVFLKTGMGAVALGTTPIPSSGEVVLEVPEN